MASKSDVARLTDYEERSAQAMLALALAFLGLYAMQVLWLSIPPALGRAVVSAQYVIWAIFIADFAYRMFLAPRRLEYALRHPMDVATLAIPMLRPLRSLRIFAAARVLIERSNYISYGRVATAIAGTACFVVIVGALVVLDFERFAADSSITNLPQALWWAVVTITTVGYGDLSPVTGGGQLAATVMMVIGISLIGAVTASFAAWFTQRVQGSQREADDALLREVRTLRSELAEMRAQLGQSGWTDTSRGSN